ncbi:MAG: hypothetical protein QF357_06365, partial [Dehalococcoidia bacterium]|nr:hypothetical protein [Dehalococcoidia bacterium]
MTRIFGLLPLVAFLLAACWVASESGEAPDPVISFGTAADSVDSNTPGLPSGGPAPLYADTLVDSDMDADVVVVGYVVVDSTGA